MKKSIMLLLAACLFGGLASSQCSKSRTAEQKDAAATAAADTAVRNEGKRELIAYYFHGTIRCHTCLSIEKQSKETVETEFADLIAEGRVVFVSVNYDESANEHFGEDYALAAPSLVLSLRNNGAEVKWKNLEKVWDFSQNPPALREYVTEELRSLLMEQI